MKQEIFTDVFPIEVNNLPNLTAYRLQTGSGTLQEIGGKLSYRLKKNFGGHWVWTGSRVLTNTPKDQAEINTLIEELWKEEGDVFKQIHSLNLDEAWQRSDTDIAQYVDKGIFSNYDRKIKAVLQKERQDLTNAYVERNYDRRNLVINNKPAISLAISSNMVYKQDLNEYSKTISDLTKLIGIWVADKTKVNFKGAITKIIGTVKEHRTRLLAYKLVPEIQKAIEEASEEELVVQINGKYDYIASCLNIILRMDYISDFNISPTVVTKTFKLSPQARNRLVNNVCAVIKTGGIIPFNSKDYPDLFLTSEDIGFKPELCFGNNQVMQADEKTLVSNLYKFGVFKKSDQFLDQPIKIGLIDARTADTKTEFSKILESELRKLGFESKIVGCAGVNKPNRFEFEHAINRLESTNYHILLALLPDENEMDEDDDSSSYRNFKSLTVNRGIPSQVIQQSTLNSKWAIGNVAMGIIGKTGNIPFVLANPLDYADVVVGIDVAREKKKKLSGSVNATAIARIYFNNGEFLKYSIHDAPLEGETIPKEVLESLFPYDQFQGKRIIIHRDGPFRGNEKQDLKTWGKNIGAEFYFVEILKTGSPRIYMRDKETVNQPPKGTIFQISETEAFMVSSLPPFKDATPQPLQIRTDSDFGIKKALHSVLSLTLLHYGSIRSPRLPVTIHYSDKIGYLTLRGIKPRDLEGKIPFWL
jgi:hypothetical protein